MVERITSNDKVISSILIVGSRKQEKNTRILQRQLPWLILLAHIISGLVLGMRFDGRGVSPLAVTLTRSS